MSERLASALREVESELEDTTAQVRLLSEKVEHLRKARDGLRGLLGLEEAPVSRAENSRRPVAADAPANLREGISRVLLDAERQMDGHEIEAELRRRGWAGKSPSGSIYEATRRMAIDGQEIERVGRNRYLHKQFVEPQAAEDPAEAGSSTLSLLPSERRTEGADRHPHSHPASVVEAY